MRNSGTFSFALALLIGALASSQCVGSPCEVQKLTAPDATAGGFGSAVSLDGDIIVVGAPWSDEACPEDPLSCNSGSAYVFRRDGNTWVQEQKLTASDARAQEEFGDSVAVSGETLVVGTPGGCTSQGCTPGWVYVFGYDGSEWVEQQKLLASDPAALIQFGHSVSISNDVVFVGAPWDPRPVVQAGSAYVFRYNGSTWVQERKLTSTAPEHDDYFGESVSVSGDVAVVGVKFDRAERDCPLQGCLVGSAYIFRHDGSTWVEEQILTASDRDNFDQFGGAVSLSGDVAVVGALGNDDACPEDSSCNSGAAYIFRDNGSAWIEEQKLTAFDGAFQDWFGWSVGVSGDVAVVGSFRDDDAGPFSGSAYVFRYDGSMWVEEQKLTASDASAGGRLRKKFWAFGD